VCVCVCVCVYIYIYIYIYKQGEGASAFADAFIHGILDGVRRNFSKKKWALSSLLTL